MHTTIGEHEFIEWTQKIFQLKRAILWDKLVAVVVVREMGGFLFPFLYTFHFLENVLFYEQVLLLFFIRKPENFKDIDLLVFIDRWFFCLLYF